MPNALTFQQTKFALNSGTGNSKMKELVRGFGIIREEPKVMLAGAAEVWELG